jgi:hypothetical protein
MLQEASLIEFADTMKNFNLVFNPETNLALKTEPRPSNPH